MNNSLSKRGKIAADKVLRIDLDVSMEAAENIYDPVLNPDGVFPLSVAENRLLWDVLKQKFQEIAAENTLDDWVLGYTSASGSAQFREAVANFYQRHITKCRIDPASLACSPGATGIVEMTGILLADPGDVFAVPAPCYPVYRQDFGNISGLERYDIQTFEKLDELHHGPLLNLMDLEAAKAEIEASGKQLKILLITSPDNPTGIRYSSKHLEEMMDWCEAREIHLIFNEIYALSLIDSTREPIIQDYPQTENFDSFAFLMSSRKSNYFHHWYSFSKDFGISGFRVGILHSHNEALMGAYENYNLTHSVSNHTQWLLVKLLEDELFINNYIKENSKLLTNSYIHVIELLRKHNIPYVPSSGGLFVWADFSNYLTDQSEEAEIDFWQKTYQATGVLFTPGNGFGHKGFGFFRIVYPYVKFDLLKVAMDRLDAYLTSYQS